MTNPPCALQSTRGADATTDVTLDLNATGIDGWTSVAAIDGLTNDGAIDGLNGGAIDGLRSGGASCGRLAVMLNVLDGCLHCRPAISYRRYLIMIRRLIPV